MITAIQSAQNIDAYSALANLSRLSGLTQGASSSFSIPGTIVTLGAVPSLPLAYNAVGQFETLLRRTGTDYNSAATGLGATATPSIFSAANILLGVSSDSNGQAFNTLLSADLVLAAAPSEATGKGLLTQLVLDMTQAAAPLGSTGTTATTSAIVSDNAGTISEVTTPVIISATPTTVASVVPANSATRAMVEVSPAISVATADSKASIAPLPTVVTENIGGTAAEATSNLASNFLADDIAQMLVKIASDPSYANLAASLFMNAAIFRSQHASVVAFPNISGSVQPVKEVPAISPV